MNRITFFVLSIIPCFNLFSQASVASDSVTNTSLIADSSLETNTSSATTQNNSNIPVPPPLNLNDAKVVESNNTATPSPLNLNGSNSVENANQYINTATPQEKKDEANFTPTLTNVIGVDASQTSVKAYKTKLKGIVENSNMESSIKEALMLIASIVIGDHEENAKIWKALQKIKLRLLNFPDGRVLKTTTSDLALPTYAEPARVAKFKNIYRIYPKPRT